MRIRVIEAVAVTTRTRPDALKMRVQQDRHEMVQGAASVTGEGGQKRSIALAGDFPVSARQNGPNQQDAGKPFDGHVIRVRWRDVVFRVFTERSMSERSGSLHGGPRPFLTWQVSVITRPHRTNFSAYP